LAIAGQPRMEAVPLDRRLQQTALGRIVINDENGLGYE